MTTRRRRPPQRCFVLFSFTSLFFLLLLPLFMNVIFLFFVFRKDPWVNGRTNFGRHVAAPDLPAAPDFGSQSRTGRLPTHILRRWVWWCHQLSTCRLDEPEKLVRYSGTSMARLRDRWPYTGLCSRSGRTARGMRGRTAFFLYSSSRNVRFTNYSPCRCCCCLNSIDPPCNLPMIRQRDGILWPMRSDFFFVFFLLKGQRSSRKFTERGRKSRGQVCVRVWRLRIPGERGKIASTTVGITTVNEFYLMSVPFLDGKNHVFFAPVIGCTYIARL